MSYMLPFGIVSDEISPDFEKATHYGLQWGIRRYELRVLKSGRVPQVDQSEIAGINRLVKARDLNITAISPGFFKAPVTDHKQLNHEIEQLLPRTINIAQTLGSSIIIIFGFKRLNDEDVADQRKRGIEMVLKAAEAVADAGMVLAIENEPGFLCDTGRRTADFIKQTNHPAVKINWDPCNSFGTDEMPYPDGYEAAKEYIVNVHAKDTQKGALVECLPLGQGKINWPGQIQALLHDRIVPHITIETHCLPLIEQSEKNVKYLNQLISKFSDI